MKNTLLLTVFLGCLLAFSCTREATMSTVQKESTKDYAEPPHIDLVGARWVLRELNGDIIKSTETKRDIYIRFKDSTTVEGFGGCNRIAGQYLSQASKIKIGPLVSTRMSCSNDSIEYLFLQSLEKSESYTTDSKFLYLNGKDKVVVKLEAIYM